MDKEEQFILSMNDFLDSKYKDKEELAVAYRHIINLVWDHAYIDGIRFEYLFK